MTRKLLLETPDNLTAGGHTSCTIHVAWQPHGPRHQHQDHSLSPCSSVGITKTDRSNFLEPHGPLTTDLLLSLPVRTWRNKSFYINPRTGEISERPSMCTSLCIPRMSQFHFLQQDVQRRFHHSSTLPAPAALSRLQGRGGGGKEAERAEGQATKVFTVSESDGPTITMNILVFVV